MEETLRDHLLSLRDAYVAKTGASESTVAQAACGDWRFFERIQADKSFRIRTYDRALRWFAERWPADLPWPNDIERPSITEASAV